MDDRCGILIVSIFLGMEWHKLSRMTGTYGTPYGWCKNSKKIKKSNVGAVDVIGDGREREISDNFNAVYIQH